MKKVCAFIFLVLYGCGLLASPGMENECAKAAFQKEQHQSTHSCCNQPASQKGCCPDHQCQVQTNDNAAEIVTHKEFNPQSQLLILLRLIEQTGKIHSELFLRNIVVPFSLHKIRIHLYNRVLRI